MVTLGNKRRRRNNDRDWDQDHKITIADPDDNTTTYYCLNVQRSTLCSQQKKEPRIIVM
jgi:hypothetical protein